MPGLDQYKDNDGNIRMENLPPELRATVAADLTKQRSDECVPIARELLKIIANDPDLLLGEATKEEQAAVYKKLFTEKIEPFLREKNIKVHDLNFIFSIILQPVDNSKIITIESMNDALDKAIEKKLGKEEKYLRISDIVEIQGEGVDKSASQG